MKKLATLKLFWILKSWIYDRAEEIIRSGKADRVVCLMDIPDDWDMELDIISKSR